MRYSPSTCSVSLLNAFMLSLPCALARFVSNRLISAGVALDRYSANTFSTSSRAYQTSRFVIPGERRHRLAVGLHGRRATITAGLLRRERSATGPRSRSSAASRLTSHSNGPGLVSSKSLMSNMSAPIRRRETPEVREVRVAARLHPEPGVRRAGQIGRHDHRRAPVEGERRREHPLVAERHEVGNPASSPGRSAARSDRPGRAPAPTAAWAERGTAARAARPMRARCSASRWTTGAPPPGEVSWTSLVAMRPILPHRGVRVTSSRGDGRNCSLEQARETRLAEYPRTPPTTPRSPLPGEPAETGTPLGFAPSGLDTRHRRAGAAAPCRHRVAAARRDPHTRGRALGPDPSRRSTSTSSAP